MPKITKEIKDKKTKNLELLGEIFAISQTIKSDFIDELSYDFANIKEWIKSCIVTKNSKQIVSVTPYKQITSQKKINGALKYNIDPVSELNLSIDPSSISVESIEFKSFINKEDTSSKNFDSLQIYSSTPLNTIKIKNENSYKQSISVIPEIDSKTMINDQTEIISVSKSKMNVNQSLSSETFIFYEDKENRQENINLSSSIHQTLQIEEKSINNSFSSDDSANSICENSNSSKKRPRIIKPESIKKIKPSNGTAIVTTKRDTSNKNINPAVVPMKKMNDRLTDASVKAKLLRQQKIEMKKTINEKRKAEVEERRKKEEQARQEKINNILNAEKNRQQFLERKAKFEEQQRQRRILENKKLNSSVKKTTAQHDTLINTSSTKSVLKPITINVNKPVLKNENAVSHNVDCNEKYSKTSILAMNHLPIPFFPSLSNIPLKSNSGGNGLSPIQLIKEESFVNYGISDLEASGESDCEDSPKKPIPRWAENNELKKAIKMNDLLLADKIFGKMDMPLLFNIFPNKKLRYFKRTSSACWSPCINLSNIKFK